MDCENAAQVHAYHDDELSPEQVAAVEAHLAECPPCRELLADLRQVSRLIAAAPLAEMPAPSMTRMQQAWWAAQQDRGVLRVASWLTAAAAAVILGAVFFSSPTERLDTTVSSGQLATLMAPADFSEQDEAQPQDEVIDAAQWIANDLALAMR